MKVKRYKLRPNTRVSEGRKLPIKKVGQLRTVPVTVKEKT